MLRGVIIVGAVIAGLLIGANALLRSNVVLEYCDRHRDAQVAPTVLYGIGQLYYFFQGYDQANRYFGYVFTHAARSPLADDSFFYYLMGKRFSGTAVYADYEEYPKRFPDGKYRAQVQAIYEKAVRSGPVLSGS